MLKRRRLLVVILVILASISIENLFEGLGLNSNVASAQSANISYSDGVSLWDGNVYSKKSQIEGQMSLDAGTGNLISDAYYMGTTFLFLRLCPNKIKAFGV